jgi:NADH-quinone oxidoreductase subunit L
MSARLRRVQNGFVRSYALTMMLGVALVGVVIVLGRLG